MKTLSLEEYKILKLREVHQLENHVTSLSELRFVLNESWFRRVTDVINSWDDQRKIDDGAYNLFRILSDELQPALLNKRLSIVEALAREQNRLRPYRKTRGELASAQTNQVLGSLFEINILSAAISSCSSIELFPMIGNGGSDVEAKIEIEGRPIYVEAKTLGYSEHDVATPFDVHAGAHSVDSMMKQIFDALNEKLAKGRQLHVLSANFPTVLFLALGFNADIHSGPWGIESYYQECNSNISSIFLFGSALCRELMKAFPNKYSTLPLLQKEVMFFQSSFYTNLVNQSVT